MNFRSIHVPIIALLVTLGTPFVAAAQEDEKPVAEKAPPAAKSASACVPGAQVECACSSGKKGVQVCSDDGSRLGKCMCGGARGDSPAPELEPKSPTEQKRRSPALMWTGITFLGLGAVGTALGIILWVDGGDNFWDDGVGPAVFVPTGVLLLAGGIMTPLGAEDVSSDGGTNASATLVLGPSFSGVRGPSSPYF